MSGFCIKERILMGSIPNMCVLVRGWCTKMRAIRVEMRKETKTRLQTLYFRYWKYGLLFVTKIANSNIWYLSWLTQRQKNLQRENMWSFSKKFLDQGHRLLFSTVAGFEHISVSLLVHPILEQQLLEVKDAAGYEVCVKKLQISEDVCHTLLHWLQIALPTCNCCDCNKNSKTCPH